MFLWLYSCSENSKTAFQQAENNLSGQELYLLNCASCHGEKGDLGVSGAKNLRTSELDEITIEKIIRYGKNGMPAFKGIITEQKAYDSLARYVISFRK
ncbi:MAG: hypothetical protein RL432_125 [Bacteroidota bacterium]|jgi:mono/diheme cytochrome c family protein